MLHGHTLVYDEFTRSSPEANAAFLSVLEERVLPVYDPAAQQDFICAHPEFRVILTSNTRGYLGVNGAPDALLDRMVTLSLETLSDQTEAGIVAAVSGIAFGEALNIVRLVRHLRDSGWTDMGVSMRSAILMARLTFGLGASAQPQNREFLQICVDVLGTRIDPRSTEDLLQSVLSNVARWTSETEQRT